MDDDLAEALRYDDLSDGPRSGWPEDLAHVPEHREGPTAGLVYAGPRVTPPVESMYACRHCGGLQPHVSEPVGPSAFSGHSVQRCLTHDRPDWYTPPAPSERQMLLLERGAREDRVAAFDEADDWTERDRR